MDVPFEFTRKKLGQNRKGEDRKYLKGEKDIHELDLVFQEQVRNMYLCLVKEDPDFQIINCGDSDDRILPPKSIFTSIINKLRLD